MKHSKDILFAFALVITALMLWYAIDVFFLAFAAILLALLLHSIGYWTSRLIRLPYVPSLLIGLLVIAGIFTLIFWLYTPLIVEQFEMLAKQLPQAVDNLQERFAPYLDEHFLSGKAFKTELTESGKAIFSQVMSLFSTTIGSIVSFVIFLIVGFYLAMGPEQYVKGFLYPMPNKREDRVWEVVSHMGNSLRYWLLAKMLSMIAVGILTYAGLWILGVPLAFILGLLAGLLTFIPYVGPILASIPAILIAFADYPLKGVYVILLFIGIHMAEGYLITPVIEQRTVSIPPALTIMGQVLTFTLFGGLGLALASPLIVVLMSLIVSLKSFKKNS